MQYNFYYYHTTHIYSIHSETDLNTQTFIVLFFTDWCKCIHFCFKQNYTDNSKSLNYSIELNLKVDMRMLTFTNIRDVLKLYLSSKLGWCLTVISYFSYMLSLSLQHLRNHTHTHPYSPPHLGVESFLVDRYTWRCRWGFCRPCPCFHSHPVPQNTHPGLEREWTLNTLNTGVRHFMIYLYSIVVMCNIHVFTYKLDFVQSWLHWSACNI